MAVPIHETEDDAFLVRAVQHGDAEAFTQLYRRHHGAVRRSCRRLLRDSVEAEEVAQAVFVRALDRIEQCRGERRFGPWVQVIAQRMCVDVVRSRSRVTPSDVPVDADGADGGADGPEDLVVEREQAKVVRDAIAALPPRQRDAMIARELDNRRSADIAAELGVSIAAVDSLLLRARRRVEGRLRREPE